MTGRRYVRQSGDGSWEVLREGDRRARVRADTESEALRRAKEIVTREGGGEVRVVNRAGKVVSVDKVARAG